MWTGVIILMVPNVSFSKGNQGLIHKVFAFDITAEKASDKIFFLTSLIYAIWYTCAFNFSNS